MDTAPGTSAAQRTIAVIGDAWTLRILRSVFRGQRRYRDFMQGLGVSRAVLADRLGKLVLHGVLRRDTSGGGHPQYRLTDSGLDLWSLFMAMWLWEIDWGTAQDSQTWAPDVPRMQLAHVTCGHTIRPQLRCLHCRDRVSPFETRPQHHTEYTDTNPSPLQSEPGTAAAITSSKFRRERPSALLGAELTKPSQRLVRTVGDRWNSAVVAAAFRGVRLFSQFQEDLNIGPAQLSDRLNELQQLGILQARAYGGVRHEYRLTKAGVALFPIVLEMVRWGQEWQSRQGDTLTIQHLNCNHILQARWHCEACSQVLERATVRFG